MASHYSAEIAYSQKVSALAGRTTTQSRDIFDLYWLISSGIEAELPLEMQEIRAKAVENALSTSFSETRWWMSRE